MGQGNNHVLPDSRLRDQTLGSQMVDWPLPGGGTVRVEAVHIFCMNCGKLYGWVPKDNCAFTGWMCRKCHEAYGDAAGQFAMPDDEFARNVAAEMEAKFGRVLTDAEIVYFKGRGELGTALELLEKESPYPVPSHPA